MPYIVLNRVLKASSDRMGCRN